MWKISMKKIETEWEGLEMWSMSLIMQPRNILLEKPNQKQQDNVEKQQSAYVVVANLFDVLFLYNL